jgi:hypothetical protein
MPGSSTIARGNIAFAGIYQVTASAASVAATTTIEQSLSLPGVQPADLVLITKGTAQAGLSLGSARVSSAGTLGVTFVNTTAAPIVPIVGDSYTVIVFRPENLPLPSSIV